MENGGDPPIRLLCAVIIRALVDEVTPKEASYGISREADFNRIIRGRIESIADELDPNRTRWSDRLELETEDK